MKFLLTLFLSVLWLAVLPGQIPPPPSIRLGQPAPPSSATPSAPVETAVEKAYRDALYAEEVRGDVEAALKAYQAAAGHFARQRQLAAGALYRQGECLRKLARNDEAAAAYREVIRLYPDQISPARMARENLVALGQPLPDAEPASGSPPTNPPPAPVQDEQDVEISRLEILAKNSPDLLRRTDDNPLQNAIGNGWTRVARFLLDQGVVEKGARDAGGPSLIYAASCGELAICKMLLDAGADINSANSSSQYLTGMTALGAAIASERTAVATLLLEKGADPNLGLETRAEPSRNGFNLSWKGSPLLSALRRQAPDSLVKLLLEYGAEANQPASVVAKPMNLNSGESQSSWNETALVTALQNGKGTLISLLLKAGADPNGVSGVLYVARAYPLDIAVSVSRAEDRKDGHDPTIDLLLEAGARWEPEDRGNSPLAAAISRGLLGYVQAALDAGADFGRTKPWSAGSNALDAALVSRNPEMINFIRTKVLNLPIDEVLRRAAALNLDKPILSQLIAQGANPAARDADGRSALDRLAARLKSSDVNQESFRYLASAHVEESSRPEYLGSALRLLPLELKPNGRLPEEAGILLELGANPNPLRLGKTLLLDPLLWKAARITYLPSRDKAVWISDDLRRIQQPVFTKDGAVGPESLCRLIHGTRGWQDPDNPQEYPNYRFSRISIVRKAEGSAPDEEIVVDLEKIAAAGDLSGDIPLRWGDIVQITYGEQGDASRAGKIWEFLDRQFPQIQVRLQPGKNQIFANANANANGPESGSPVVNLPAHCTAEEAVRITGICPLPWGGSATCSVLPPPDDISGVGALLRSEASGPVYAMVLRHGDTLSVTPGLAREPSLSDEAQQNSWTLGLSANGPFYRLAAQESRADTIIPILTPFQHKWMGEAPPDCWPLVGEFVLGFMGPAGLDCGPLDWSQARVKRWDSDAGTWSESALTPDLLAEPAPRGTLVIVPPLSPDATLAEVPAPFGEKLTSLLTRNFEIAVKDGAWQPHSWQPPFFKAHRKTASDPWIWRDADPAHPPRPAVPDLRDLLASYPDTAGEGWLQAELQRRDGSTFSLQQEFTDRSRLPLWLVRDATRLRLVGTSWEDGAGNRPLDFELRIPGRKNAVLSR